MHQLSDIALEAILKEFHPQEYNPPHTDVREWLRSIELLCDTYGIPDVQRPHCATTFAKGELSTELGAMLAKAREAFGPVHWDPFKNFMVAFDRECDSLVIGDWAATDLILQALSGSNGRVSASPPPRALVYTHAISSTELPFYKKHPKYTGAALGVTGGILLAPVAAVGLLSIAGFTSAGVAAGNLTPSTTQGSPC